MDRRLQESVTIGDISTLRELVKKDENLILQTISGSLNTILHLAARFGHLEFAEVIVKICPELVSMENGEMETPLHQACREGYLEIVKLLLESEPAVVYKVNCREESVLFAACERGKIDVVKHLMNFPRLLMLELDIVNTSLHVGASSGNTEIVKEILKARPDLAWKKNFQGWMPLHISCSKGHLEITKELVKLDSDLCLIQDVEGRTPLHCAAMKGRINIIDEILSISRESVETMTCKDETILHLAVKNNQYEVVRYLTEMLNMSKLLNVQDCDGNSVLHLATAGKLTAMVIYLLKIGIEVNSLNKKGYTALDVIEADASNSGSLAIVPALLDAGAKRCDQLSPGLMDIQQLTKSPSTNLTQQAVTFWPNITTTPEHRQSPRRRHHHRHNHHRAKKLELQNEGLRNARKTVTIVAVLIATVTFAAGVNPPGGFNQQTGKAIRGNRAAFKVFLVCDIVALFLSIGVVNVLVSIIPFTRETMMRLLTVTHKVMWLSTLFMAAAFIAAIWTIMPTERGGRWVAVELVVFGGGSTVVVFLGLGLMLARHWHNKYKWRKAKQKKMKDESPHSSISRVDEMKMMRKNIQESSSNSDVDSSDHGYHLY